MSKLGMALLAWMLLAPAAEGHVKRTDRCGCHNQYGNRHCHPTKKSGVCEAPVSQTAPAQRKARPVQL